MAKIVATFDTSDKSLIVDMDGKKFKNVSDVSFFQSFSDDGKFFAQVSTRESSEEDGVTVHTTTMASDGTITKSVVHGPGKDDRSGNKDKKDKKDKKSKAEINLQPSDELTTELSKLLFRRAR